MKWFISDLHLDNKRLFEGFRKDHFGTMEAWQEAMIDGIRRSVRKTDQLFLLGDIAYDPKELFRWRRKMPGQVWLIKGNHDPSDAACERVFGRQFRYGFETKIAGTRYWLSHYPHAFWPDSHNGSCHLYGHCHGKREETLDTWMPQRRSMEVSPEVLYGITSEWRPIGEMEIWAWMHDRTGHDHVSFYDKWDAYQRTQGSE
jgi:calcineurin-like phosphoesterase family protein